MAHEGSMLLEAHVREHLLESLAQEPEIGYAVYCDAVEEGKLHAIVVVPRECIRESREYEPLLRRHPDAVVWVAPQWTSRTGKVWRSSGSFPLTADEWLRLRDVGEHHIFLSEHRASTRKRRRDLVTALHGILERYVFER